MNDKVKWRETPYLKQNKYFSSMSFYQNIIIYLSLVIRQNGESQNAGNKKAKQVKFSEKTNISYVRVRIRK